MSSGFTSRLSVAAMLALSGGLSQAANFNDSDTFANFNDAVYFKFTAGSSTFSVQTSGWANGGFDPMLTLYDGSGNLVTPLQAPYLGTGVLNDDSQDAATVPPITLPAAPNIGLDSSWEEGAYGVYGNLVNGDTYYLMLSQALNFGGATLADPLQWAGLPDNPTQTTAFGFNDNTNADATGFWQLAMVDVVDGSVSVLDQAGAIADSNTPPPGPPTPPPGPGVVPEIDAMSSTGALTLVAGALALAGQRRRRSV